VSLLSEKDIGEILEALREGDVYRDSSSGGRYATTCSFHDGAFFVERFEEGLTDTYRMNDAEMRAFVARSEDDVWLRMLIDWRKRRT